MLELALHHVAYAVDRVDKALESFYLPCLGAQRSVEMFEDPLQKVRVAWLDLPGGRIELVEPLGVGSPVARLLAKKQGGVYHVGFSTPELDQTTRLWVAKGCRVISGPTPAVAFQGRRIVFLLTANFDLVELIET